MLLKNRHIIVGVSGGIAAYKTCELIRGLRELGALVRVVMTQSAKSFITPLTLQALSGHPVHDDLFDPAAEAAMGHIELAKWAEVIVIAPATAETLAKLAHGRADDLLSTICLATSADILVAPAMNQAMWRHPATQRNIAQLQADQKQLIGPDQGVQACGDVGPGRMVSSAALLAAVCERFLPKPLSGKTLVITAGPTQEPLDPVRFLSNKSSGKMGFALAESAAAAGATVHLISGPVSLATPRGVSRTAVTTAQEMYDAVHGLVGQSDIFIACAAVCDMRPQIASAEKQPKQRLSSGLALTENSDIVKSVCALARRPYVVAFAAETCGLIEKAKAKRLAKKCDMILANLVGGAQGGFDADENAAVAIWESGEKIFTLKPKKQLATDIIALIGEYV